MSGFSAASVPVLSYDFTAFPKDGSDVERCSGKGRIPEPSKAKLDAFWQGLPGLLEGLDPDADEDEIKATVEEGVLQRISDVCSGKPSADELRELPPRILFKFAEYLRDNLAPKA